MYFEKFIVLLFLIYETSFYMVIGQMINEEKSDCTKLYNFLNGDSQDYSLDCCSDNPKVKCDNEGYITYFSLSSGTGIEIPNFSSFPFLSKIEELYISVSNLKEIPTSILKLNSLKKLSFGTNYIGVIPIGTNNIEVIPSAIQDLPKLEELYLNNNLIKEVPNELFNLPNLKKLELSNNKIEVIPPTIKNLINLEEINLYNNKLKEVSNEIFNLPNLKILKLNHNPSLDIKMIKTSDSTIKECNFEDINILCYEPHTCELIRYNNKNFSDADAEKILKICPRNTSFVLIGGLILGGIVLILIGILVTFILIKKGQSRKTNKSDFSSNDNAETGRVVFIKDDKDPGTSVMTLPSLNNNQNNNNDVQIITPIMPVLPSSPPSYSNSEIPVNSNNNNETMIYYTDVVEEIEPPPEYTEINSSVSKQ